MQGAPVYRAWGSLRHRNGDCLELSPFRGNARWFASSREYKAEVLAQPSVSGQLKHIEWDGWGGAPVGDWTVYLVFDPTDSLSAAARSRASGKFNGIPCAVDEVRSLESHWYSVTLAMNEWWEQCR
jgi:hypothetical protein